jgi:hypothetical protein
MPVGQAPSEGQLVRVLLSGGCTLRDEDNRIIKPLCMNDILLVISNETKNMWGSLDGIQVMDASGHLGWVLLSSIYIPEF